MYVDSVPPQRERACLDLLSIHESVQYSVKHLAVSTVSLLQVLKITSYEEFISDILSALYENLNTFG